MLMFKDLIRIQSFPCYSKNKYVFSSLIIYIYRLLLTMLLLNTTPYFFIFFSLIWIFFLLSEKMYEIQIFGNTSRRQRNIIFHLLSQFLACFSDTNTFTQEKMKGITDLFLEIFLKHMHSIRVQ